MAIYGIGAYSDKDESSKFLDGNYVGVMWSYGDAPDLHEYIKTLKVGDIIYIKSWSPNSEKLVIKGIGIINNKKLINNDLVSIGYNVVWKDKNTYELSKPSGKFNVRNNTLYEEFDSEIQSFVVKHL